MNFYQLRILTERNFALRFGDTRTLIMASVQSTLVGLLLGYAYSNFGTSNFEIQNSKLSFVLVFGITCLWIGCAGASQEIVGELQIYLRERDINLSTLAFVLSKFLVASVSTVLQVALLLIACSLLVQEIPGHVFAQFLLGSLASVSGVALGLLISSLSNSRDQAAVVVPLALAPQLIFGSGLISSLSDVGMLIPKLLIGTYWAREAMTSVLTSTESLVKVDPHTGTLVAVTAHSVWSSVSALCGQTAGWLVLAVVIMYWRFGKRAE